MTFNIREDEIIGSFDNHKACCIIYYDKINDVGVIVLNKAGHGSVAFRFTKKEEVVIFETMLKKLKLKINDTFDEKEYTKWKKQTDEVKG